MNPRSKRKNEREDERRMRALQDERERERRTLVFLSKARSRLMNDTKWREVLSAIADSANIRTPIRWSFVGEKDVSVGGVPSANRLLPKHLPDVSLYPYGPYREIDWIEVPATDPLERTKNTNDLKALAAELEMLGQLPLTLSELALRINGYVW